MSEDTTTVSWAFEALTKRLLEQRFMYHFAREGASKKGQLHSSGWENTHMVGDYCVGGISEENWGNPQWFPHTSTRIRI